MTFQEKLRYLLEDRGCDFEELADALSIEVKTVKHWFEPSFKKRMPKAELVANICRIFDLESDYFDECFDDDYARLRSNNQRKRYTRWSGDSETEG